MKFIICLVLLAGSTLLARCGDPLSCDPNIAQEVRIAAGEKLKEALVSENYPNNYPNHACQRWDIMAEENQCIEIYTGNTYFITEEEYDSVFIKDMGSGKETYITGEYFKNSHEFTSETNYVVVEFDSDEIVTAKGFKLDLKSRPCLQDTVTKTYNDSDYTLIPKMQNFEKSRQECMDLGGDLAVITSMQEHNFIGRMIVDAAESVYDTTVKGTWIGLYKTWENRNLHWVDGTPFEINEQSWVLWGSGQPNDYGSGAVYLLPNSFRFADRAFWNEYWALCEKSVD